MDWKAFFETYRLTRIQSDADLLYQVGATVGGKAISAEQVAALLGDCRRALELGAGDTLLDLCAGNGVLTGELAKEVKVAVGVDFSQPYIENARKHKARPNAVYLVHDVSRLETCEELKPQLPVSKVMCYSSLAYLTPAQVERTLGFVAAHSTPDVRILLGSVLDKARRWKFFNTWPRKLNYLLRVKLLRREFGLGRWWTREELVAMAARHGFSCEFLEQNTLLHTAHYRYDVLLRRKQ
jgi:cyclopropane fatty-acyl-phospholipid synthase-like methyltransferase